MTCIVLLFYHWAALYVMIIVIVSFDINVMIHN